MNLFCLAKTTKHGKDQSIKACFFKRRQHVKLQLHDAIYWLRFYSSSLIHILSLSNSHNNVASIQKNRDDKSHRVIVASQISYRKRESSRALEDICKGESFIHFNLGAK